VKIQSASAYPVVSLPNVASRPKQSSAVAAAASSTVSSATSAETTSISQAARDRLAAQSGAAAPSGSGATAVYDTNQGALDLDIDDYFTPHANTSAGLFSLPPLLLPNQKNIDALASHISAIFPRFLKQNNIPFAPSSVTYDTAGKIQLPADYPYASEFKQALANNPVLERELSTVNALTSHLVEMRKSIPFQRDYAAAKSQAEADAVVARYSYLFSGNRHYSAIALHFSANGGLTLSADGKPLS
jgi:hypothetical protein